MHSEPCEASRTECLAKIANGSKSLTIFLKLSILDISQGSEYAYVNFPA